MLILIIHAVEGNSRDNQNSAEKASGPKGEDHRLFLLFHGEEIQLIQAERNMIANASSSSAIELITLSH